MLAISILGDCPNDMLGVMRIFIIFSVWFSCFAVAEETAKVQVGSGGATLALRKDACFINFGFVEGVASTSNCKTDVLNRPQCPPLERPTNVIDQISNGTAVKILARDYPSSCGQEKIIWSFIQVGEKKGFVVQKFLKLETKQLPQQIDDTEAVRETPPN